MKKLIILVAILSGCSIKVAKNHDYTICENGDVYQNHNWSVTPDYNHDGWYEQTCQNCGLKRKINSNLSTDLHYGVIAVYANPETGKYSDYRVYWQEDGSMKPEEMEIKETDIRHK